MIDRILRGVNAVVRVLEGALDPGSISQGIEWGRELRQNVRKGRLVACLAEASMVGAGVAALSLDGRDGHCGVSTNRQEDRISEAHGTF